MIEDRRLLLVCVWCGPAAALLALLGLVVVGGFVPPQAPSDSAWEIGRYYADNATQIRVGMALAMTGFTLFVPFGVALAMQTRRTESRPILTYIQVACVAVAVLEGVMAAVIWGAAAFRPGEISDEITRALNDLGWFAFLFDIPPFTLWIGAVATAILRDPADDPILPRWAGYLSLWVALLILPGMMMAFFKHGAFGFNGILALYLPAGIFFVWMLVMSVVLIKVVNREGAP